MVARGETLTSIAKMHNVTVSDLQKANHIENDRKLQIGQTLIIPEQPAGSPSPAGGESRIKWKPGGESWYLRKGEDNTVFGPLSFEQMWRWARNAQIAPHDSISHDQVAWMKAPMLPELGMDWLVEVTSERYYGPTTLGAVQEFIRLGEIVAETFVINACDGSRWPIDDLPGLADQHTEGIDRSSDAPPASSMAINLRDRIKDLEQNLFEERRALEESEARYRELEARYHALQSQNA